MADALDLIRSRQWFEAHESLEDLWREAEGKRRRHLQGLLHIVVSLEHLRRGNPRGCQGQWDKARQRLADVPPCFAGLEIPGWMDELEVFFRRLDLAAAAEARLFTQPIPEIETWPIPALAQDNSTMR
ncbi:MAG: DUF309 domain-containing protein [Candidatus Binatia bacterium]|nr:DUF309 domain-containing protein [Candidatus Binatia bacterium]MDG1958286.1 DUF309 domain-containing protein [Candidatus Binatia bacterium]MDG2009213.1 DUF309 domain-containing protein [Candidatus Binatia bacterium]HAC81047.1 hypothetical protein [Deltaproteobacteria bacterium]